MIASKSWVIDLLNKCFKQVNSTPTGTIISFMGKSAPKDYLTCDGTIYNIANYQNLAEFIKAEFGSYNYFGGNGTDTFAVPDLRGEFLRGSGTNGHANQGSGSNVGEHQDGTEHIFLDVWTDNRLYTTATGGTDFNEEKFDNITQRRNQGLNLGGSTFSDSNRTATYTSRPTNTSILYCIKY